jgi:hypothetical protein
MNSNEPNQSLEPTTGRSVLPDPRARTRDALPG